jgi:hypothetical protein
MSDYMPGAVQVSRPDGVTLDASLPPRFVWHITWDALQPDGSQPAFSAVANYLQGKEWCPHIMWNPFTGYMEQYYPADVGARALTYNDQDGAACVQVEIFFTPGCVVDGVKYNTVADTPLKGWAELLAWADSLGVPRTWPMGAPQWQNNARDVGIWNGNGGHYGHCNSPGDTHTDPGPMPALTGTINTQSATITPETDMPLTKEEVDWIAGRVAEVIQPMHDVTRTYIPAAVWDSPIPYRDPVTGAVTGQTTTGKTVLGFSDFQHNATRASVPAGVLNQKLGDGTNTNVAGVLSAILNKPAAVTNVTGAPLDVDALVARLKAELPAAQFEYFKTQITKP